PRAESQPVHPVSTSAGPDFHLHRSGSALPTNHWPLATLLGPFPASHCQRATRGTSIFVGTRASTAGIITRLDGRVQGKCKIFWDTRFSRAEPQRATRRKTTRSALMRRARETPKETR